MYTPDFERDNYEGQMNPSERKLLFNLVTEVKPDYVFEVGTCRGGGSTYFISSALMNNKKGTLFTCESYKEFYDYAQELYRKDELFLSLKAFINFNFGDSLQVYPSILDKIVKQRIATGLSERFIEVCLIDGGEDSIQLLWEFAMFRPFIPVGGYVLFHDWDNGKTQYIRPLLVNDIDWELTEIDKGLAVFKRVKLIHK